MKTKEVIIKTALKLFLSKGFNETSMNEIAQEVGVSKPAIYHHFKNKDELVGAIFDYFTQRITSWGTQYYADCTSDEQKVHRMFEAAPLFMQIEKVLLDEEEPELSYSYNMFLLLMSRMKATYKSRISQDLSRTRHKINEILGGLQQEGIIRNDIDSEALALMMHAIIEGLSFIGELIEPIDVAGDSEKLYNTFWKLIKKENE